jgi:hypothetical protein
LKEAEYQELTIGTGFPCAERAQGRVFSCAVCKERGFPKRFSQAQRDAQQSIDFKGLEIAPDSNRTESKDRNRESFFGRF